LAGRVICMCESYARADNANSALIDKRSGNGSRHSLLSRLLLVGGEVAARSIGKTVVNEHRQGGVWRLRNRGIGDEKSAGEKPGTLNCGWHARLVEAIHLTSLRPLCRYAKVRSLRWL